MSCASFSGSLVGKPQTSAENQVYQLPGEHDSMFIQETVSNIGA